MRLGSRVLFLQAPMQVWSEQRVWEKLNKYGTELGGGNIKKVTRGKELKL